MTARQVRIIAPEVHDGLGGIHRAGETPALQADVADVLVARSMAVELGDVSADEVKRLLADQEAERRIVEQKARADAVMRRHDSQPEAQRLADQQAEKAQIVDDNRTQKMRETRAERRARERAEGQRPGDDVSDDQPETKH